MQTLQRAISALLGIFNAAYANFVSLVGLPVATQQGRSVIAPVVEKHSASLRGFRIEWLDLNVYKIMQNLAGEEENAALATVIPALADLINAIIERYRSFLGPSVKLLFDRETRIQIAQNSDFLKRIGIWGALPAEIRTLDMIQEASDETAKGKDYDAITLPFGHGEITFRMAGVLGILNAQDYTPVSDLGAAVRDALANPLGTPPLSTLAVGAASAIIIVDDQTRPTPTSIVLPLVLQELVQAGVPESATAILVATGMHRAPTAEELARIVPTDVANRYRVIIHNCKDNAALATIAKARSGAPLTINRAITVADIVIAIGMIAPHPYAGFTGGAKSILPGSAALESIIANHTLNVFPTTGPGKIAGNPVQEDIEHAGRCSRLTFIVNIVLNSKNEPVAVFAGDPMKVVTEGFQIARQIYRSLYPAKSDVAIVSCGGYPRDANLYMAVRAVKTASLVIRRGGYIVLVAGCEEEIGPKRFVQVMHDMPLLFEEILNEEPEHVIAAHVLKTTNTITVSRIPPEIFQPLGLRSAVTVEDALHHITTELGRAPSVLVIPNGWAIIPELTS